MLFNTYMFSTFFLDHIASFESPEHPNPMSKSFTSIILLKINEIFKPIYHNINEITIRHNNMSAI